MKYKQARKDKHFRDVRTKLIQELYNNFSRELNEKIMLWDTVHGIDWWHGQYTSKGIDINARTERP